MFDQKKLSRKFVLFKEMHNAPASQPSECDDFHGFYPLKSITIDKIMESTNDLEKSISDLMMLLDNNSNSISIEQSEKVFSETIKTIELSLSSYLNYLKIQKSPQLRSIVANTSKETNLFSLFYDYTQLAIKVYNQKIFYNPSFFQFIIFFTNLCCHYIDIFQNPNQGTLKKDFQDAWHENYTISTRIQYFYKEVGIINEFCRLERYFDQNEMAKINQITDNNSIIYEIDQSLKTLKRDLQSFEKYDNFPNAIQNMIVDLEVLRSNFLDLRNFSQDSDKKIFTEKLNAISSFLTTLESCVSFYNLCEMANKLNIFIRNDVFSLPSEIVHNEFSNWICFKLSIQAIQLNLKMYISIRHFLNHDDPRAADCFKLSKKILSTTDDSLDESKIGELVNQFLDEMKNIVPLNDSIIYKNFIDFYEERIDAILKNIDEKFKDCANRVKSYFDNFKKHSKIFEERKNLFTATSRFNFFSNFEDSYRCLKKSPHGDLLKIDENLFKIKYYLDLNVIYFSNQILINNIQNIFCHLTKSSEAYDLIEKRRNLRSIWKTMLNLINSIYSESNEPKESKLFLCSFKTFLKASITVLELNEQEKSDKYGKVISYILNSFPRSNNVRLFIPVQNRIDELRSLVSKIQSRTIKANEDILFSQNDKKDPVHSINLKDSPNTFAFGFFDCEERIVDILKSLKHLETIRQCMQFFSIYESFITNYELKTIIPIPNQVIQTSIFYFERFTNEMIFMLKSPYLNISLSPSFMKKWIEFIRALINDENSNKKEIFAKLINKIPFIDYSKLFRMAFFNFHKIDSLVRKTLKRQKSEYKNIDSIAQLINEKEMKYNDESNFLKNSILNFVVSVKQDNSVFDIGKNGIISTILQISSDLYLRVQKYWSKLILISQFYEKFNNLIKFTQDIKNDLQIEKKEFPKKLNQYVNLLSSICLSLNEVSKSNYISSELKQAILQFNQKINEVQSNLKYLYYDDVKQLEEKVFISLLIQMQDLEKSLIQTNVFQFTNALRTVLAKTLPVIASSSSDQNYTKFEDTISDILQLIDDIEKDSGENKFAILFEMKQKVKLFAKFQDSLFIEFSSILKNIINCELNISFVKSQLAIHNIFLLQISSENLNMANAISSNSVLPHQISYLPPICQIPEVSKKFEIIISQINSIQKYKNEEEETKKDSILSKLATELSNAKTNAELRVRKIIDETRINQQEIKKCNSKHENYRKLQSIYEEQLKLLNKTRDETRAIKMDMNEKLNQVQNQVSEANKENLKLLFDLKRFSDEKAQIEYLNKQTSENLQWAKNILTYIIPKFPERRKNNGKTLNPVMPVIPTEVKDNPIPKNAKVNYAMIIELEQRFQKAVEKNKNLWMEAKSFSKSIKIDESVMNSTENETVQQPQKNENRNFKECESLVKNDEIVKEFKSTVETVYELFKRSNFLQQVLFSAENNDRESLNFSNPSGLHSSSSSSNLGSSSYSSASSSGYISSQISSGNSGSIPGVSYDDDDILDILDAFNNELFDRSMKFFFINKILQRKNEKKSRRKIKVKKHKKSILKETLESEIQNQ